MNAYRETHTVTFTKNAERRLRDEVISKNFTAIIASTVNRSVSSKGWAIFTAVTETPDGWHAQTDGVDGYPYLYTATLTVENVNETGVAPGPYELAALLRTLHGKAEKVPVGAWTLATVDDNPYLVQDASDEDVSRAITDALIGYAPVTVPDDYEDHFSHLFGLDSHISIVKRAILAGIQSGWRKRLHCALIGPPGCGKSDLCQSLKRALGDAAVMEYDATATTGAGAIKDLNDRDILPRVLIVEEIEKADPAALSFLLGVMDMRGEIRKTTHRSKIERETKLFVIATVNNVPLFKSIASGALYSRFVNKIHFKRPSRDMLAQILTREVADVDGDTRWIEPTLDYTDDHKISDPRQAIALCLVGADGWLDGTYVKELADTEPEDGTE